MRWKPTKDENPNFKCSCGSNDIIYVIDESDCGGFEDINYKCNTCGKSWWVESSDA